MPAAENSYLAYHNRALKSDSLLLIKDGECSNFINSWQSLIQGIKSLTQWNSGFISEYNEFHINEQNPTF